MIRKTALAVMLVSISPLALAHAHLTASSPANDAVLSKAPESLQVTFTEGVETALSRLEISSDNGMETTLARLTPVEGKANTYKVALPQLKPGHYHLDMKVTSVDTHRVTNTLDFSVR